jgi:RNA polymerase primary sigma factor
MAVGLHGDTVAAEEWRPMSRRESADDELIRRARSGDRGARDRVVGRHLGLVRSLAMRYRDIGLPLDDLVQEGSFGLLDAIDHYDGERGPDFETYARFRVRRAIRNALTEQARLIRLPKQIVERRRAIERTAAEITAATGRPPSSGELAAATGLPVAAVVEAREVGLTPVSLDQPVLDDGSPLESLVVDEAASDPEAEVVGRAESDLVDEAVEKLPSREREIVTRHFGIGCDTRTLADVAVELHLSEQRTRTIELRALYELRDLLEHDQKAHGYENGEGRRSNGRNGTALSPARHPR